MAVVDHPIAVFSRHARPIIAQTYPAKSLTSNSQTIRAFLIKLASHTIVCFRPKSWNMWPNHQRICESHIGPYALAARWCYPRMECSKNTHALTTTGGGP